MNEIEMYRRMVTIRRAEEEVGAMYKRGEIPGPVHLYIGQEAVAAGVCSELNDADWITSTHRGHGHFLGKGGDLAGMFAELLGRESGICKGKGGSMHVADVGRGMLGANGIVGGGIGIACGAALAAQVRGKGEVSVAFFGDGAANQGVLMEAMNVAALWRLPLIFVCEANGYSEFSKTESVSAGRIGDRPRAFGVPVEELDGNDVFAVQAAARKHVDRARRGNGPAFLMATTYRVRGHVETEHTFLQRPYRTDEEVSAWRERDPLTLARKNLIARGATDAATLDRADREVEAAIEAALKSALAAPDPAPESALEHMFA